MFEKSAEDLAIIAGDLLEKDYHCSEAVFLALGRHYLGEVCDLSIKMVTPFAGGVGCTHNDLCGALTGGLLLIGALHGRSDAHMNDDFCQQLAAQFRERFYQHFEYLNCEDLRKNWRESQGLKSCRKIVEDAAVILIDLLENHC